MPHTVPTEYKQEKNKQSNAPILLFTLHDYDGASSNLNFAAYKTDVVFDGVTYQKFPVQVESIGENAQGEVDSIKIKIANVNQIIPYYLENYDLREKKITIKQVWANLLSDTDNYLSFEYYIDSYASTETTCDFTCTSKLEVMDVQLPFEVYLRGVCTWLVEGGYKGTQCGATSSETTCDGTMAQCRLRNNILRFGGFPSIPTQRTFIS